METQTYADSIVASLIGERYVPVRVDRDRRPDVDRRYNMGGWPSTVFLTPEGELLHGETYLDPSHLAPLLVQVSQYYRLNEPSLRARFDSVRAVMKAEGARAGRGGEAGAAPGGQAGAEAPGGSDLPPEVVREAAGRAFARGATDATYGGFAGQPKFPLPASIRFALQAGMLPGGEQALGFARTTLENMERGAIYDRIGGGFHRYAAQADWSAPEFEKLLALNAALAEDYLLAFKATGDSAYLDTGRRTVAYLRERLFARDRGLFYGSEDAGGGATAPGLYYLWTGAAIERSAPPRAARLLGALYGFAGRPDGTAPRPLQEACALEEAARRAGVSAQEAPALRDEGLAALGRARARRPSPGRDPTFYVDGNALAALALLRLADVSAKDASAAAEARGVVEGLLASGCSPETPVPHWIEGPPGAPRLLRDQSLFAQALFALYCHTGEERFLTAAARAAEVMTEAFGAAGGAAGAGSGGGAGAGGALVDRIAGPEDRSAMADPVLDIEDNGRAARLLLALAEVGAGPASGAAFRRRAAGIVRAFTESLPEEAKFAGDWAFAAQELREPPLIVAVSGPARDPLARSLAAAAWRLPGMDPLVLVLDPRASGARLEALGIPATGPVAAYLIRGRMSFATVRDPVELAARARAALAPAARPAAIPAPSGAARAPSGTR